MNLSELKEEEIKYKKKLYDFTKLLAFSATIDQQAKVIELGRRLYAIQYEIKGLEG